MVGTLVKFLLKLGLKEVKAKKEIQPDTRQDVRSRSSSPQTKRESERRSEQKVQPETGGEKALPGTEPEVSKVSGKSEIELDTDCGYRVQLGPSGVRQFARYPDIPIGPIVIEVPGGMVFHLPLNL